MRSYSFGTFHATMRNGRYTLLDERGVLALDGPNARDFLQGMISNDVRKVDAAHAIYAAVLTPQGKFAHDFIVAELGPALVLDCERARLDDLVTRLNLYKLRAKVTFTDRSQELAVAAVMGEGAAGAFGLDPAPGAARPLDGGAVLVDPRLAALGVRAILPRERAQDLLEGAGCTPAESGAYERHRLALGIPDGSRDIVVERSFLLESNFEELNGVDFEKGCYVGQENTARQKHRGTIRKRLVRVDVDGPLPAPGTPIMLGDKQVGTVRSGLERTAIALMRRDGLDGAAAGSAPLTAGEARLTPVQNARARS